MSKVPRCTGCRKLAEDATCSNSIYFAHVTSNEVHSHFSNTREVAQHSCSACHDAVQRQSHSGVTLESLLLGAPCVCVQRSTP